MCLQKLHNIANFIIYCNMLKLFDLHNDFYLKLNSDKKRAKYIEKYSKTTENIVSAVWTTELDSVEAMKSICSARDFVNAQKKLFLGVEDLHFLSNDLLESFFSVRPIYAGLTWNNTNCLAGGAHESGKLTAFGKQVVKGLELSGTQVDTAHLNEESFMDISKISSKPLFCSHSACYGVNHHSRNLKDYQIKMIVDSGGLFGLCLVSDFLNGVKHCGISDIVMHIDYFACKFGINNLAFGTDFYGTKHLPNGIKDYNDLVIKLSDELSKLGFTEKSLNKIFYENAHTFLKNTENL